jgi:cytochrome c-type biogenesis protein CcmH
VLAEYAEALALANPQHKIAGEPRALLDKALKLDPQNQRGLWLSGIADSQEKNYAGAIATWNRLLPLLPKDSDVFASVKKQIAQAEALRDGRPPPPDDEVAANEPATATAETTTASPASAAGDASAGPHIAVTVSLDPKLKSKVDPNDVLFVFAKAVNGPPMPLAIARLTAAQLPASITLTDGMGMLPTMKLSQFPQVIVGARISKSGNAIAQSGDLQTLSAPIPNTRAEPLALTIDQVVP